jgi:bacterioferritin-associated ferredoxin
LLLQAIRINNDSQSGVGAVYVCVCNAIRECEFRRAARLCEGDAEAVYASLGKVPQCGQCLEDADMLLAEERDLDRRPALVA